MGRKTIVIFTTNEELGDRYIVYIGMELIAKLHSVILGYGDMGIQSPIKVLCYTDEDVAVLSAFMLASDDIIRDSSISKCGGRDGSMAGGAPIFHAKAQRSEWRKENLFKMKKNLVFLVEPLIRPHQCRDDHRG